MTFKLETPVGNASQGYTPKNVPEVGSVARSRNNLFYRTTLSAVYIRCHQECSDKHLFRPTHLYLHTFEQTDLILHVLRILHHFFSLHLVEVIHQPKAEILS